MRRGFTLIELLVVIAIVAVIAVVLVVTLNPSELLKQARDSNRISDLTTLNKALAIYQVDVPGASLGTPGVLHISLPDSSPTCANLGLPDLPAGYTYACKATSTYRNTDGTGWIPVNFNQLAAGSPVSALPVDPQNTTTSLRYYLYTTSGTTYSLSTSLESQKYLTVADKDGGNDPLRFETGSDFFALDLSLFGYWKFDEGSGSSAVDLSGHGNDGALMNNPTWANSSNCKKGGCLSYDGLNDYVIVPLNAQDLSTFTTAFWTKSASQTSGVVQWANSLSSGTPFLYVARYPSYLSFYVDGNYRANSAPIDGNWQHIAISLDQNSLWRFYLNGSLITTYQDDVTHENQSISNNLFFGNGYHAYYTGLIDEYRLYNRALSGAEIEAIYNAEN